jgi:pimeloyl-ACP methyl ester carboxylesterase
MSDDVIRYADAQNIDKFLLVGHSMGGKIGTYVCHQHPSRLHGAIIMEAPPVRLNNVGGYALKIKSHVFLLREL